MRVIWSLTKLAWKVGWLAFWLTLLWVGGFIATSVYGAADNPAPVHGENIQDPNLNFDQPSGDTCGGSCQGGTARPGRDPDE